MLAEILFLGVFDFIHAIHTIIYDLPTIAVERARYIIIVIYYYYYYTTDL